MLTHQKIKILPPTHSNNTNEKFRFGNFQIFFQKTPNFQKIQTKNRNLSMDLFHFLNHLRIAWSEILPRISTKKKCIFKFYPNFSVISASEISLSRGNLAHLRNLWGLKYWNFLDRTQTKRQIFRLRKNYGHVIFEPYLLFATPTHCVGLCQKTPKF